MHTQCYDRRKCDYYIFYIWHSSIKEILNTETNTSLFNSMSSTQNSSCMSHRHHTVSQLNAMMDLVMATTSFINPNLPDSVNAQSGKASSTLNLKPGRTQFQRELNSKVKSANYEKTCDHQPKFIFGSPGQPPNRSLINGDVLAVNLPN